MQGWFRWNQIIRWNQMGRSSERETKQPNNSMESDAHDIERICKQALSVTLGCVGSPQCWKTPNMPVDCGRVAASQHPARWEGG